MVDQFEGVTFVVTHGVHGTERRYERRVVEVVSERVEQSTPTVAVCGHSHEVLDTVVDDIRLLNPGSATGMYPATEPTRQWVTVKEERMTVQTLNGPSSLD